MLDTLRADRLSAYGNPRRTSPVIDGLAQQGVLFESAVSNASWTLPAMAGLFSGDFPTQRVFGDSLRVSLVERIRGAGWRTAAFVEGGFLSASYGFDRGFEHFESGRFDQVFGQHKGGGPSVTIDDTFGGAAAWLRENAGERFFLLIHSYEPHTPYERRVYAEGLPRDAAPETFGIVHSALVRKGELGLSPADFEYVRALYDGGVAECDRQVGGLLQLLEELGVAGETAIVLTSDHGEDLGGREPRWPGVHGHALYDEQVLVPLIVRDPTRTYPASRVAAQVRSVDTLPTILDLLGLPADEAGAGRSLVPLMEGVETGDRLAWSRTARNDFFGYPSRVAIRTGTHKLIVTPLPQPGRPEAGSRPVELYDLRADPGERVDLAQEGAGGRARLERLLGGLQERLEAQGMPRYRLKRDGPDDVEERLRELGYVE